MRRHCATGGLRQRAERGEVDRFKNQNAEQAIISLRGGHHHLRRQRMEQLQEQQHLVRQPHPQWQEAAKRHVPARAAPGFVVPIACKMPCKTHARWNVCVKQMGASVSVCPAMAVKTDALAGALQLVWLVHRHALTLGHFFVFSKCLAFL